MSGDGPPTAEQSSTEDLRRSLQAYLDDRHGRPERVVTDLVPLGGGWASALHAFTYLPADPDGRPDELVVKQYDATARGREHADREWRALTGLGAAGYPVPAAHHAELEHDHLGRPFVIMDRVPGVVLGHALEGADPETWERLVAAFVDVMLALHELDPRALDASGPRPYLEHELVALEADAARTGQHGLARVVQWLRVHAPEVTPSTAAIVHRDLHPWNVVVDAAGELWVLDWDWQIGDPRFDLAWTCAIIERGGDTRLARRVRQGYERSGGRSIDSFAWFEVLTTTRWVLNVIPASRVRADFRAFLVGPLRRAGAVLRARTGCHVAIEP